MATWVFRPQRHTNGGGIFANFVGSTGNIVTATGAVAAQPAISTGQIFAYNQINATGNALAQPAVTTGQVKVFIEVFATGDAQADPAVTTGQVTVTGVVVVTGAVDGQPATTTGLTETSGFLLATGAVTGQPATTTGQILIVEPVQASGSPQAQPATTTGLAEVSGNTVDATGNALAQAATTTGSAFVIVEITATGAVKGQPAITSGQARVPRVGPFDIRMKAPDGEWVEINTHDSQIGITPDNHHPQLHDLDSHTDISAPTPILRDGTFWDGVKYVNDRRVNWVNNGVWVAGTYESQDQVRQDGWTMVANKQTTDYPAPQTVGSPYNIYDGLAPETSISAKQIVFGNRYTTVTTSFQLITYSVYTFVNQEYNVYLVQDPLGADIVTPLSSFTAATTGWSRFNVSDTIVLPGSVFDVIAVTIEPPPAPTPVDATYNYLTPQNFAVPTAGQIQHSRNQSDVMSISYTDDVAGDRTALITNLSIGDTIDIGAITWTVQTNSPQAGYANITVTPAIVAASGVQTVTFITAVSQPTDYMEDVDYWPTSPFAGLVQGVIGIDVPHESATINDSAYGTDVTVVEIELSEDWDVVAAGDAATGSSVNRLTDEETIWVQTNTEGVDYSDVMTAGNTWTTMGVITLPLNTGFRARSLITARRTDGFGIYHAEAIITAINDGGSVSTGDSVTHEFETSAALDTRVNISGSTVEFQVKGQAGQDWHWMAIIFNREIT